MQLAFLQASHRTNEEAMYPRKAGRGAWHKSESFVCLLQGQGSLSVRMPKASSQVVAAARKHASVEALENHVATGQALRLNLPKRQQRTSKKAAGRRGKRSWTCTAGKKKKRKKGSKKEHKKRDQFRRPKATKNPSLLFSVKQVRMAVQKLRASGWLVEKKTCSCGDKLVRCPWKLGMSRGKGRAYLRCTGCRRWYDIMAFSPLPVLKMPLPLLYEAIAKYFAEVRVPSVQSVARALQVSGGNHSPLFRLFRALQMAEVRCMDWTQSRRTLTGQCDEKVKNASIELS